jgi:hypothetical protein
LPKLRTFSFVLALPLAVLLRGSPARALEPRGAPAPELAPRDGLYVHLFGALAVGRGIRFNNPYRLSTPLGNDAESLSLTSTYADLSANGSFGDAEGFQHGASLHLSIALAGVPQEVATPGYVLVYPFPPNFFVYGRAALPIIIEPDTNVGYELAAGGAWLWTAGIGATAELVGDLFYGAATQERSVSVIPVLSFQFGIIIDYEILP